MAKPKKPVDTGKKKKKPLTVKPDKVQEALEHVADPTATPVAPNHPGPKKPIKGAGKTTAKEVDVPSASAVVPSTGKFTSIVPPVKTAKKTSSKTSSTPVEPTPTVTIVPIETAPPVPVLKAKEPKPAKESKAKPFAKPAAKKPVEPQHTGEAKPPWIEPTIEASAPPAIAEVPAMPAPKRIVTPTTKIPEPLAEEKEKRKKELVVAKEAPFSEKVVSLAKPVKKKDGKTGLMRIAFVSSECVPYAKTGGLGDAVAGLAKALQRLGHGVRIIMPLYQSVDYTKYGLTFMGSACVHMGGGEENWVGVHSAKLDGEVEVWFVDYGRFFNRPGIYHDHHDYTDNAYRFGLLGKAAMQLCKDFAFIPDVMHLHDWQAAPAAAFLKTWDRFASPLSDTASVLTIHNIGHQGKYHAGVLSYYGLGNEHFTPDKFEDFGGINLLKAGIAYADAITTVSPTHAREILEPIGGQGLEIILQRRASDVSGILNGVDYEHWNPETDHFLPARYSAANIKGKATCKAELQKRFGLEVRADVPLFGIVSRFAPQKGLDLLTGALPRAINGMVMQLVVLGTGDPHAEGFFNWLRSLYPQRVGVHIGFSNELSHMIEAGSDFFLMPSLYEPCGLNQIYSLAYGTLPVVRATGGLADSVENYDEATGNGTGFVFQLPTAQALYDTVGWAVSTWYDRPQHYKKLQQQAMAKRFPWENSAKQYLEVYKKAKENRRKWV